MTIPKVRDEASVPSRSGGRQAVTDNEGAGIRIKEALGDREISWLSRETGYGDTTIRDAIRRGPVRADVAVAIAKALGMSVDWLLSGGSSQPNTNLRDADHADWIEVPEYDLREMTDESRGPIISTSPIRKDWLNREFGRSSGLWLARLPADLPRHGLRDGDLVLLRDVDVGEAQDGATYIIRIWGQLTVARINALPVAADANREERFLTPRDIGVKDGQAILVARLMGIPLKRL